MAKSAPKLSLLVIDDDRDFRTSLVALLSREGAIVKDAESLESARTIMATQAFDALFVDQQLPDGQGLALLGETERKVGPEIVMITGHATVNDAIDALKQGALDYLTKPLDPAKLESTLVHLRRTLGLKRELSELREELRQRGRFGTLIGRSASMQPVFDLIQRVAPTNASVLIQGESGTGKEIVAAAIHELSQRADKPLLAVNCGAIPESLIESELFGHEKGSFTGADRQHKGHFERADGGTLFLDEITEMPLQFQVRLLRVLETGMVHRVGSSAAFSTDVRVLAATNRDPIEAIRAGKLREDLYFRLAVFPMRLPPLRERQGDVSLLAQHFLEALNETNQTDKRWADGALAELEQREWKGNVRELKNAVQRAYILADDQLRAEDTVAFPTRAFAKDANPLGIQVGTSIAAAERELIQATLDHVLGDKPAAAAILGISLKTLYNRLNVYEASHS
ncbi:MAG TPA: sigma-54 dependent transcriptional regulator [Planctomycetota bacterium]|nr:sigma-54 dependent transcriptional regulator [Planctomycetota bacterium]